MEKESREILKHNLIQLREELVEIKQLLHDANILLKECKRGFEIINETGNIKVADVFLEELSDI